MLGENLEILKKFESDLKERLIKRFGAFLPKGKEEQLNNTQYVMGTEFLDGMTKESFQGNLIRLMLDSIIDVTCTKEISTDGVNTNTLVYGRDLEDGIIEYYTKEISLMCQISVDEKPELYEYVDLARRLKDVYPNDFDNKVFNENASQLLSIETLRQSLGGYEKEPELDDLIELSSQVQEVMDTSNNWNENAQKLLKIQTLKDIAKKCDENAVKEYLKTKQANSSKEETDSYNIVTSRKDSVQIIYLDNKQYIKYIDVEGKLHLVLANNSNKVLEYYKDKVNNLGPDEQLNSDLLFNELCQISNENKTEQSESIDIPDNSFDEQNVIRFVDTYKPPVEINMPTPNNVETPTLNETQVVQNEVQVEHNNPQEQEAATKTELTPEEYEAAYEEACFRYINEDELRPEDLKLLVSNPDEANANVVQGNGPKKKMAAFANKQILIYILLVVSFIGVFIGAMIFSMTN